MPSVLIWNHDDHYILESVDLCCDGTMRWTLHVLAVDSFSIQYLSAVAVNGIGKIFVYFFRFEKPDYLAENLNFENNYFMHSYLHIPHTSHPHIWYASSLHVTFFPLIALLSLLSLSSRRTWKHNQQWGLLLPHGALHLFHHRYVVKNRERHISVV